MLLPKPPGGSKQNVKPGSVLSINQHQFINIVFVVLRALSMTFARKILPRYKLPIASKATKKHKSLDLK